MEDSRTELAGLLRRVAETDDENEVLVKFRTVNISGTEARHRTHKLLSERCMRRTAKPSGIGSSSELI